MSKLRTLSLFAGIGGFETVAFCEIDPFCRQVLAKHWPTVRQYEDVRELTAERLRADGIAVDVICGGFPCQDISEAGLRKGIDGEQSGLWSEYARIIGEVRPSFVIVENSAALLWRGLGRILGDLATIGYDAEWHCIPASAVGAPHERDRLWLVAYPDQSHGQARLGLLYDHEAPVQPAEDRDGVPVWLAPPSIPARVGDGAAAWVDRRARTEVIGNAVVPQIVELIGRAILRAGPHLDARAA